MTAQSILIVEDSITQREFLAQMCRDAGASAVVTAENGQVALTAIANNDTDFDIVICDLEMPDLDGIELINMLAARKLTSAIVIVSGREQSLISAVELMAKTEGLWVLGAIKKPLKMKRLQAILRLHRLHVLQQSPVITYRNKRHDVTKDLIEQALKFRRFVLHYQPKINMQTNSLHGVEALVRLAPGNNSIIFPNDFIPLCEACELIDELTYEVVRLALDQAKAWKALGHNIKISINLSAVSFDNPTFCNKIMELIKLSGTDAKSLIFEVTETAVVKNIGKALSILARLKLSGCGLSIDDYGTGYSSVKQMAEIPFNELKIDRSLIDGVSRKKHLQVIFESTLSMCNKLGLEVVAEGIEKKADWDYLLQKGCHQGQGYYISPPMPEHDLLTWLDAGMPSLI